jgi:hypothetical protein
MPRTLAAAKHGTRRQTRHWTAPGNLEALIPGGGCRVLPAQRKYPEELRKCAVKMMFEIRDQDGKGRGELARAVVSEALRRPSTLPSR